MVTRTCLILRYTYIACVVNVSYDHFVSSLVEVFMMQKKLICETHKQMCCI
jgi:hypothetical protein